MSHLLVHVLNQLPSATYPPSLGKCFNQLLGRAHGTKHTALLFNHANGSIMIGRIRGSAAVLKK